MVYQKLVVLSIFCMSAFMVQGQSSSPSVIATSQLTSSADGFLVSATIGQLITPTATNGAFTVTQGFQQPTYTVFTFVEQLLYTPIEASVFPNPCQYECVISTPNQEQSLALQVYDVHGRLVYQEPSFIGHHSLNTSGLANGTYVLHITETNISNRRTILTLIKQ